MSFKPLNGYIAVKLKTTTTTESGIVIPDTAGVARVVKAEVVEVSAYRVENSREYAVPQVKQGSLIAFLKGTGIPVKSENGEDLILIKHDEILGFFTE